MSNIFSISFLSVSLTLKLLNYGKLSLRKEKKSKENYKLQNALLNADEDVENR